MANLEKRRYFDPRIRNLVLLDDLMSVAKMDRRMTNLFTEGSHHRNLTVIVINKNLYQSKDPTQTKTLPLLGVVRQSHR